MFWCSTDKRFPLSLLLATSFLFGQTHQGQTPTPTKELRFKLLSGELMPMVGYGTYQVQGAELVKEVLDHALSAGYRAIDSAAKYSNEEDIGKALKELLPKHNLTRQDIFITTKLAPLDHGEKAYAALEKSLANLDCGYIDLYLIHWPGVRGNNLTKEEARSLRDQSWRQMVRGVKNGLTKNIGVSNYNVGHMKELLENDHGIKPAVNQVEWHPFYHQPELLDLCNKEGILLEAYSSLGGTGNKELISHPEVTKISEKLGRSPAQVLLRWALQQNIAILPKSKSKKYIAENIDLDFTIPEEDMKALNGLPQKKFLLDPNTMA